jgi:hypothetical protein
VTTTLHASCTHCHRPLFAVSNSAGRWAWRHRHNGDVLCSLSRAEPDERTIREHDWPRLFEARA